MQYCFVIETVIENHEKGETLQQFSRTLQKHSFQFRSKNLLKKQSDSTSLSLQLIY